MNKIDNEAPINPKEYNLEGMDIIGIVAERSKFINNGIL